MKHALFCTLDKTISPATVGSPTLTSSQTTSYEVTQTHPPNSLKTDTTSSITTEAVTHPLDSSNTDTTSSTTTEAVVNNKATWTESLIIVAYIIAPAVMVWMLALTGLVLVNLYVLYYKTPIDYRMA